MRAVNAGLAAYLDANTNGEIRHLVTITPQGGSPVRWTDAPYDLSIVRPARPNDPESAGAQTYGSGVGAPTQPLVRVGPIRSVVGLEVTKTPLALLCGELATWNGVRLPLAASQRAFDLASVKIERVFGSPSVDTSLGCMHVFEGRVGAVKPSSSLVMLDVESGIADLSIEIPRRVYQPGCPWVLFDARCGLVKATYTVTGTVAAGATTTTVPSNRTEADDYFGLGVLTFTSGVLNGIARAVTVFAHTSGVFTLDRPLPSAPANGDTFSVYPGCDKRISTCKTKFTNGLKFGGFPRIPQNEVSW